MRPRTAAALHQAGKAKADIRWHIGAHPEQFAHGSLPNTLTGLFSLCKADDRSLSALQIKVALNVKP
jgi:hypothetical protein